MFLGQPPDRERSRERREGRRQSRRPFRREVKQESHRGSPIIENWLLKPRLAEKSRRNPVAGLGHSARDPDVSWLVGANQTDGAEVAK